jgi:hypothetical protein
MHRRTVLSNTVAEAAMTIDRKGGMVRHLVLKAEPAEPPIGKVELDLTTESALGADRVAVADQEHPDHQLGIDRRTSRVTVERRESGPQPAQIENSADPAQQMIIWNAFLEIEFVEQPILSTNRWPHHRHFPT